MSRREDRKSSNVKKLNMSRCTVATGTNFYKSLTVDSIPTLFPSHAVIQEKDGKIIKYKAASVFVYHACSYVIV